MEWLSEGLCGILTAAMLAVCYFDARYFIIPNWLNAALLVFFPAFYFIAPSPIDWQQSLILFGILFAVGFALFSFRLFGGGDVKLLAVLGLYTGWNETGLALIVYMALMGGALSIIALVLRILLYRVKTKPRLLHHKEPVPYGLAIAGAFLWLLLAGRVPGIGEIQLF